MNEVIPAETPENEVVLIIKGAAQTSKFHEEIIYSAGITPSGKWVRLYPVSFRRTEDAHQFRRWDRIQFAGEKPADDSRAESIRVRPRSMEITGELFQNERQDFLTSMTVHSLSDPSLQGKSLALLRPNNPKFFIKRKTEQELAEEKELHARTMQSVLSADPYAKPEAPKSFSYKFNYTFTTHDGEYNALYRDWEMDATFGNLAASFGEPQTVARAMQVFGKEYTQKGILFAMSRSTPTSQDWQINGVICVEEIARAAMEGSLNLTA